MWASGGQHNLIALIRNPKKYPKYFDFFHFVLFPPKSFLVVFFYYSVNSYTIYSVELNNSVIKMFATNKLAFWSYLVPFMWLIFRCTGAEYDMRIDLIPPCSESVNSPAYFGPMNIVRLQMNTFQLNGSLIVNETIGGPLEVRITVNIIENWFEILMQVLI